MAKNILGAVLLAFVLQACRANLKQAVKNNEAGWEDCSSVSSVPCASKELGDKKAADVFAAFRKAGVEVEKSRDSEQFSVLMASCVKTAAVYKCAFKYHQPDKGGELTPEISIAAENGQNEGRAKSLYAALVSAGLTEACNPEACTIAVTSVGCRRVFAGDSTACYLSKGTAMEVAW